MTINQAKFVKKMNKSGKSESEISKKFYKTYNVAKPGNELINMAKSILKEEYDS